MKDIPAIAQVPTSWRWQRLEESCTGIFDCPHSTPTLTADGPYIARTQDVLGGVFQAATAGHVSEQTYRSRIDRAQPAHGDLLYSREGTYFGVAAEVPEDTKVCLGQRMVLLRPDRQVLDHRYLRYWLNSPPMTSYVAGHSDGSVAQRLNLPVIRDIPIPLPPLEEQRAIAATLGALDDKIDSNRRVVTFCLELLDTLATRALAMLPMVPLAVLAEVIRRTVDPSRMGDAEVDHYSLPSFDAGPAPDTGRASTIMSNKQAIDQRSILVSRLNPRLNRTWWVTPRDGIPALASTEFLCITAPDDRTLAGLWLAVRTEYFRDELTKRVTGTSGSHQRIRPDDALSIEVPDTRLVEPAALHQALSLLNLAEARRNESRKLAALRDALLPELLSGRIRPSQEVSVSSEKISA